MPADDFSAYDFPILQTFHADDGFDLHFRLMGEHDGRAFIINVQLSAEDERTGALLKPPDYGFAVAKLMQLLTVQLAAAGDLSPWITAARPQ